MLTFSIHNQSKSNYYQINKYGAFLWAVHCACSHLHLLQILLANIYCVRRQPIDSTIRTVEVEVIDETMRKVVHSKNAASYYDDNVDIDEYLQTIFFISSFHQFFYPSTAITHRNFCKIPSVSYPPVLAWSKLWKIPSDLRNKHSLP